MPTFYLDPNYSSVVANLPPYSLYGRGWLPWGATTDWVFQPTTALYFHDEDPYRALPVAAWRNVKPAASDGLRFVGFSKYFTDPYGPGTHPAYLAGARGWNIRTPLLQSVLVLDGTYTTFDPRYWFYDSLGNINLTYPLGWEFQPIAYGPGMDGGAGTVAVLPAIVYLWRPSTKTMLGVSYSIWQGSGNYHPNVTAKTSGNVYGKNETMAQFLSGYVYNSISNLQAGDLVVMEWWCEWWCVPGYFPQFNTNAGLWMGGGTDMSGLVAWTAENFLPTTKNALWIPNIGVGAGGGAPITDPTGGAVVPNLIRTTPQANGTELLLGFDNPVGITGPTLDPASGGLAVMGASQYSTNQILLDVSIPTVDAPAPPTGSATHDFPPESPAGGATVADPTPATPVAGAFRDL